MKKYRVFILIMIIFIAGFSSSYGPPNCNIYNSANDTLCYRACLECEKAVMHGQGTIKSQQHFDKALEMCPEFDYAYYEKAVPYAKRGLIADWKKMIDAAIEIDPQEHLATRGWYHFFFMHNYEAAIRDIEKYDSLISYDIGYTGDGLYHLNIMKALCWKGLGQPHKAIQIMSYQLEKEDYEPGIYDYLHLAVLEMEAKNYQKSIQYFEKQREVNDVAEVHYYLSDIYQKLGDEVSGKALLEQALVKYDREEKMHNPYRQLTDQIYRSDITNKLNSYVQ